jgi:hypothetical protein
MSTGSVSHISIALMPHAHRKVRLLHVTSQRGYLPRVSREQWTVAWVTRVPRFWPFLFGTTNPEPSDDLVSGRNWQRPCQRQAMTPGTSYCRLDMTYSCLFDVVLDGKSSRQLSAVILWFDDIWTMADHGVSFNNGSSAGHCRWCLKIAVFGASANVSKSWVSLDDCHWIPNLRV